MNKKIFMIMALIMAFGFTFANVNANAAEWYLCDVEMIGPASGDRVFLKLTDTASTPAFRLKYFLLPQENTDQFLAVALTAKSLQTPIKISTTSAADKYPPIISLYLGD
jgi:hypothetical protein